MLHKPDKRIILLFCCFLLMPQLASAETQSPEKGEMEWKIDRIYEDPSEEQNLQETELEKTFPDLFEEQTRQKIRDVQKENEKAYDELSNTIFSEEFESDADIEKMQENLFPADYTAPKTSDSQAAETKGSNWFDISLLVALAGLGLLICAGLYVMFKKLSH